MAYGWSNAFGKAADRCWVLRHNNTRDLNVDVKVRANLLGHGICSGITSSWVIGFLSADRTEAKNTEQFRTYFYNVLRFQGAYMKDLGGRTDKHLEALLNSGYNAGIRQLKNERVNVVSPGILPIENEWAAYTAIFHHAIGIGHSGGSYYMMDPNYGLFVYADMPSFLLDLQNLIEARRHSKRKKLSDKVTILFYVGA